MDKGSVTKSGDVARGGWARGALATPLQIDFTNMLFHAAIELIRVTGGE